MIGQDAKVADDNFGGFAPVAGFVLPTAVSEFAFEVNGHAFFEAVAGAFGELAPEEDVVPLGGGLPLTLFVAVVFAGGDGGLGNSGAVVEGSEFGIAA